jgi:tellurite resistance protein TerC
LRTIMILVGGWVLAEFHWVLYVFGAFLVLTGIKMWWAAGKEPDLNNNPALSCCASGCPSASTMTANGFGPAKTA